MCSGVLLMARVRVFKHCCIARMYVCVRARSVVVVFQGICAWIRVRACVHMCSMPLCMYLYSVIGASRRHRGDILRRSSLSRVSVGSLAVVQDLRSLEVSWPLSFDTIEDKNNFLDAQPLTFVGSVLVRPNGDGEAGGR